jgi:uncharacterized protein (DUF1919 family)
MIYAHRANTTKMEIKKIGQLPTSNECIIYKQPIA